MEKTNEDISDSLRSAHEEICKPSGFPVQIENKPEVIVAEMQRQIYNSVSSALKRFFDMGILEKDETLLKELEFTVTINAVKFLKDCEWYQKL